MRVDLRLLEAIDQNMKQIQAGLEMHCCLLGQCLGQDRPQEADSSPLAGLCAFRAREVRLRKAIQEAIEVLEASRRSFKSKQLERLRKRLTAVLIDAPSPDVSGAGDGSGPDATPENQRYPHFPQTIRRKKP